MVQPRKGTAIPLSHRQAFASDPAKAALDGGFEVQLADCR
jgi:hypothetical protein